MLIGEDDHVHIISGDGLCRRAVNIAEASVTGVTLVHLPVSSLLSDSLSSLTGVPDADVRFLVSTLDGSVVSIKRGKEEENIGEEAPLEKFERSEHFQHTNIQVNFLY